MLIWNSCRIEVNLDRLIQNYYNASAFVSDTVKLTCVLKSNAYGHGAVAVARALEEAGCQSFAVSSAREALELRMHGICAEIIVMGVAEDDAIPMLSDNRITITLVSKEQARRLTAPVDVQIKLDTGMHRLGFNCEPSGLEDILTAASLPMVCVTGIYSHLGLINPARDALQHAMLMDTRDLLAEQGLPIQDIHLCDSIGMVRYPAFHHTRVRIGAFLYGVSASGADANVGCKETLRFLSHVTRVHKVNAGDYVGYEDMPLKQDALVATVQTGYGDGYPRRMAGQASVIIRGCPAPVISRVCMDQLMADVTGIPDVTEGDEVTLLGDGITYPVYARWAGSNINEILACLSSRPQRVYYKRGAVSSVQDNLIGEAAYGDD
jgi:alanine racemase